MPPDDQDLINWCALHSIEILKDPPVSGVMVLKHPKFVHHNHTHGFFWHRDLYMVRRTLQEMYPWLR